MNSTFDERAARICSILQVEMAAEIMEPTSRWSHAIEAHAYYVI